MIEGQTLASASITGGTVTSGSTAIKGTWAWMDPNTLVKAGESGSNTYKAIFTPDSAAFYNTTTADIGINVRKVATITVKQTTGGTVVIDSATVDNRYIAKNESSYTTFKEMKVKATPNAGYKFKAWTSPASPTISGGSDGAEITVEGTFTPTGDAVISATFEKATRTVKLANVDGGAVEVWNGTKQLSLTAGGTAVEVGSILTINAKPGVKNGKDQEVVKVGYTYTAPASKANDAPATEATSFTVGGASGGSYEITATFQDKPANKFMVNVAPASNGAIVLKNGENTVSPNASYNEGTVLNVIAVPNKGYRLKSLRVDGKDIKDNLVTVDNEDLSISAEFELEEYQVTVDDLGRVKFSGVSTQKYEYGKTLNISATVNDADKYRLAAILVNNKPVENNSDITIEGLVNISADVRTLSPLSILNPEETIVTYNGNAQPYVVETANKLAGFEFSYTNSKGETVDVPLNAETYTVKITRPADAVYQKFEANRTLKIEQAKPGILDIPAKDQSDLTNCTTVAGSWDFEKGMKSARKTKAGGPTFVDATFTPKDDNLSKIETKVFETEKAKESATKATISASGTHGTVGFKNGNADISADLIYVGQTITLTLKADEGYSVDWSKISGVTLDTNHSFTVVDGLTINAENAFVEKDDVAVTEKQELIEKSYTSQMIDVRSDFSGLSDVVGTNEWQFTYKKEGAIVEPINVGTYDVYAACAETEGHKALAATKVGTLKINPAKIEAGGANTTIVLPTASPVLKGTLLSVIGLNGGYVEMNGMRVAGSFAWSEDEQVNAAKEYEITFTPHDNNYTSGLNNQKVYVSLSDVQMYKMGVKIVNGGSVSITKSDGAEVKEGDLIPAGMQLTITSKSGVIDEIAGDGLSGISDNKDSQGKSLYWTVKTPSKDFTMTITFKSGSEGGGTAGEGTAVTGISLNKTTLMLPRLTSEKLVATVTPTGATKKDVKWTSTNPEVATVDADGTVKAVKYGQATIIATTVDGGFTAMCQVNVDFATAIEKILSESLVYSRNGQIIIEPAAPVEISIINLGGQVIYNNSISSTVQVPANSGIYIVRMAAAGKATTTKVIVR
ncbi:T9SS C-terminal target domain-containing protein [Parabacteroides sp. AF48-14]|uniref:Ig-like domain-containing protein n=1 Tax=Parabacteroides sp. AF48-14 TaxID=2292052 RepID=UPI000EFF5B0C|nr:Ig-like domain-containing protein [Parabacteroides sp. AF48-14]RHO74835.1 T9SS C-terminal target domain-containing protein [Parabacteroides sp. AF48-14]